MENPFYIPGDLTGTKVVPMEEAPQETVLPVQEPVEFMPDEPAAEVPAAESQEEFTVEDLL